MREIKFRAWHKKEKRMFNINVLEVNEKVYSEIPLDNACNYSYELAELEIMQYTGIKDKNCKEIYDGDIIKKDYISKPVEIKWRQEQAQWSMGAFLQHNNEIIGNIYENPDLLTK